MKYTCKYSLSLQDLKFYGGLLGCYAATMDKYFPVQQKTLRNISADLFNVHHYYTRK